MQPPGGTTASPSDQFDPSLGTLEAVSITVVSDLNASLALENLGSVAGTAALTDNGGFSLILPGMTAFNVAGPTLSASATLQAFDGTTDFAGASGTLISGLAGATSVTETIEQSLSSYIGNGTTTIDLSSFSPAVLTGPADLAAELLTNAGAVVEVSYVYAPSTSAAATGTLAISGHAAEPYDGRTNAGPTVLRGEHHRPGGGPDGDGHGDGLEPGERCAGTRSFQRDLSRYPL